MLDDVCVLLKFTGMHDACACVVQEVDYYPVPVAWTDGLMDWLSVSAVVG